MNHELANRDSPLAGPRIAEAPSRSSTSPPLSIIYRFHVSRLLPGLLLLAFFALGCAQIRRASITFDEGPHLAIGYATLRTGDFRLQPVHIHPPLANVLAAAPLLLQNDLPDPRTVDGWEIASLSAVTDAVVWQYPHPARLAVAGRTPILLLGVLLGALVYRWAKDLVDRKTDPSGGRKAGLLALTLYAFDPNLIAHGALITTDVAAVFFIVATLYALQRVTSYRLKVASRESADQRISECSLPLSTGYRLPASRFIPTIPFLLTGVLLGMAQLAKVSALMLVPVAGLVILLDAFHRAQTANRQSRFAIRYSRFAIRYSRFAIRHWLLIFLPAALVLWAGYGFQVTPVPGWPFPLPGGTHLLIFQSLYGHYDLGHPTFALGQVSMHGWPWYFPVAFVLKTPLPTLLLGLWAIVVSFILKVKKRTGEWQPSFAPDRCITHRASRFTFHVSRFISTIHNSQSTILSLWLFPCLYVASSLFSSVNIGYRHLLPILPFLYIGIGQMMRKWRMPNGESANSESANRRINEWQTSFAPDQRISGLRITNDESPIPLRARLLSTVYRLPSSRFTFHVLLLWLAIGTLGTLPYPLTFFNELGGGARNGYRYLADSNLDWGQNLWDLQRWMADNGESHVFYAHYSPARPQVYGIDADFLPPDPRAVSFAPWNPAPGLYAIGATVLQGPYSPDLNTYAWFRARKPEARLGNALFLYRVPARPAPAWAVLCSESGAGAGALDANLGAATGRTLWMDCARTQVYPAAGFYGGGAPASGAGSLVEPSPGVYITRADVFPLAGALDAALRDAAGKATIAVYRVETPPAPQVVAGTTFDGPLDFAGHTRRGTQFWTYWRVREIPAGRPLSLMAHRLAPDGTAAAVGDGLGFPVEQWRSGDLIVQRHDLDLSAGAAVTVQIGGYWLDTMDRWRSADGTDSVVLEIAGTSTP